ncbi:trypsin-like serine protease [Nitzschia inconspicua]|uniref:Trypsin-like serine protease n=1 Tax=Nitzschia inconspicua TaxID=303405 RepID=A0A9K3LE24_9STRA|nr:trypsin-like serine protease [Nitzschia inconspicua]
MNPENDMKSPTRRRQSRRPATLPIGNMLQGIVGGLERKNSDKDLSDNVDEVVIHGINDQTNLQDSNRSLGDVEFALESPTSRSPTKTNRGGVMRKRSHLDASSTSASMLQTPDFDQSVSRVQVSSESLFPNPPPLSEIDESMEKSHHKPQRMPKGISGTILPKSQGKSQELFLLRLSILFLLIGCVFLSSKHYRLVRSIKTSSNLPRDQSPSRGALTGDGTNVLRLNAKTRIIGGTSVVDPKEYPWFVLFHGSSICGGVLIASDVVLTAAHCHGAGNTGSGENSVYLNVVSRTEEGLKSADKVEIQEERRHHEYIDGIYAHDLMLVKLKPTKKETSRSWIRMNLSNSSLPQPNSELSVLGFGDIDMNENSIVVPDSLQHVTVRAVDYRNCWAMYEAGAVALRDAGVEAQELTPDQLCGEQMNAGTCAGDSGSPLFLKAGEGGQDLLVGTVAWHRGGCGNNFFPDAYSNVTWFADWIIENACKMASDPSHLPCRT